MPLKVIRHYPGNKVEKKYPAGKEREKDEGTRPIPPVRQRPTQLLSEKRLENMRPRDQDGFITSVMKLPELIDPVMEEIYDDGPLLSRMSAQLLSSDAPLQGQKDIDTKDLARSEGLKDGEKDLHKLLGSVTQNSIWTSFRIFFQLDQDLICSIKLYQQFFYELSCQK